MNHASSSPLAVPVRERMKKLVDELELGDLSWDFWSKQLDEFREQSGKLIGAKPDEICFIPNTSTGLLIALYSIPWPDDANVVLVSNCFPANRVPWRRNLKWIEKRSVSVQGKGSLEDRIIRKVDENTRVIAVDWVDFFTGYRINLGELGEFCKQRGIFLVVDGIQGAGAVKLNLSQVHVDFFSAQSAKWLLGPVGAGFLYVNNNTLNRLRPAFIGWMSLEWQDYNIFDPLPAIKKGAARFEPGSYPGIPLVGFVENLKILNSIGIAKIERRIFELRNLLFEGLQDLDAQIISPADTSHGSGILTFRLEDKDAKALHDHLTAKKIVVSLRKNAIRLSPHFYNTTEEVKKVLTEIGKFAKSRYY